MKSGILVLTLFMLALIALPLAPYGDSVSSSGSTGDQSSVRTGEGHTYQQGAPAMPMMPGKEGMTRGPGQNPRNGRHGDGCPAESRVQQELRRDPSDWNTPVQRVRFRAYRRLSGKNILEHEKRHLIYTTILMNPGIEVPVLASLTGINLHTLRYHIGHLVRLQKITCTEQGGGYHLFENHGRYDHADQQRILYSRYPTTDRILSIIAANPGITRGEIAEELGLAGPSVTRWTSRLIADRMVTQVRDGRLARHYPAGDPTGDCAAYNGPVTLMRRGCDGPRYR